jgi:hypothetical protein
MKQLLLSFALALTALPLAAEASAACKATASDQLVSSLLKQAPGLRENVLKLALDATTCGSAATC